MWLELLLAASGIFILLISGVVKERFFYFYTFHIWAQGYIFHKDFI
jgi:hypothetical protein